ncbi:3-isopropylmalate dehydrogenase [Catenibacillus scindens]|uniref:3-isopropylmalate dehydrogenase n=1 Tax=Catenibacillus scindens TaxID=673271 RepID=UPI00320803D3
MDGPIQWHPAFYSALQIELAADASALIFESEHLLSKKPMQIDVIIIKKPDDYHIHKTMGHIFRRYNLIEYKSPEDSLSINDFYKVMGYGCFYQSDTLKVMEIRPEEITLTFASSHFPRKMMAHMQKDLHLRITAYDTGIFHIQGGIFPIQVLITRKLSKKDYYWLQHLRKDLKSGGEIKTLIENYEGHKKSILYQSVMEAIIRGNWTETEAERKMCDALKELFAEDFKESENRGLQQGLQKGIHQGIQLTKTVFSLSRQGFSVEEIAGQCGISKEQVEEILQ